MGGDHAPAATVEGAVVGARRFGLATILVGDAATVERELARHQPLPAGLSVEHAAETIGMDEHAASVVRAKRQSSMHVACRLVKEGRASAAVSAGNSGAFFGVAMFAFGRLPGVDRPALATVFPTGRAPVLLLDVGANAEVKPLNLVQFALMGSVYANKVLGRAEPAVALLSNGEEEEKGPPVVQEAHQQLKAAPLRFVGNVEGKDVPLGTADVVVADGYAGNVLLKTAEGTAEALLAIIRRELTSSTRNKLLAAGLRPAFRRIRATMDYAEYGGAPLLGLRQVGIIAHGRSNAWAIANALRVADEAVRSGVIAALEEGLAAQG